VRHTREQRVFLWSACADENPLRWAEIVAITQWHGFPASFVFMCPFDAEFPLNVAAIAGECLSDDIIFNPTTNLCDKC